MIPFNAMRFDSIRKWEKTHFILSFDARPTKGHPNDFETWESYCSHFVSDSIYIIRNYYLMSPLLLLFMNAVNGRSIRRVVVGAFRNSNRFSSIEDSYSPLKKLPRNLQQVSGLLPTPNIGYLGNVVRKSTEKLYILPDGSWKVHRWMSNHTSNAKRKCQNVFFEPYQYMRLLFAPHTRDGSASFLLISNLIEEWTA